MGSLDLSKLKPHQVEALPHLLSCVNLYRTTLDLSSTGVGKTYVTCAVARTLDLPTLVIAPKVSLTAWRRVAEYFGDKHSVINYEKLRTGRTPFGWWDNTPPPGWEREEFYICQCCQRPVDFDNYDPCYCHPLGIHCIVTKKRKWDYGDFHFHKGVKFVIFDEMHRCNAVNGLNAKMLIAAKRQDIRIHGMSATAGLSPLHMQALGYACGLHSLADFYDWARRHGCMNDRRFGGFVWLQTPTRQMEIMKQIGDNLVPKMGIRLRAEDIPSFPECSVSAELYDLEENKLVDELYEEMSEAIAELDSRSERDVCTDHPLTKILRARQRLELLKVPIAVELAKDYQAKGYSVVIGANFQQTVAELRRRLGWSCFIDGTPAGVKLRQQSIDDFQANKETGMVMNIKAGGICVSLQDLHGDHPRIGLAFPSTSAVDMIQFFGRLPREGAKTKSHYRVLLAANTVEEQIQKKFNSKTNNLSALNDRDLLPDNMPILGSKFSF
jgi:hypothetical protein